MSYKSIASYLPHSGEMVLVDEIIEVGADYIITRTEIAKHAIFCETSALGMQFRTCENFGDFADSKSSLNPQNSHKYKSHTANLGSLESSDSCESKNFNDSTHPPSPLPQGEGENLESVGRCPNPHLLFASQKVSKKTLDLGDSRELLESRESCHFEAEAEKSNFLPTFSKWAWATPIKNNPSLPFLKGGGGVNPQESKNSRESQKLGEMPIDLRKSSESKRFFAYAQNDKILDSHKSKNPIISHESTFADSSNDSEDSHSLAFPTYKAIELMAQSLGIFRALNERGSGSKLGFLLGARRFEIFAPYIKECAFTKATISMQSADGLGVYDCEIFEGAISPKNLIARASISALNPSAEFLAQIKGEV